jgi:hypothetical protein
MCRAVVTQCASPLENNNRDFLLIADADMQVTMQKNTMISRIALSTEKMFSTVDHFDGLRVTQWPVRYLIEPVPDIFEEEI